MVLDIRTGRRLDAPTTIDPVAYAGSVLFDRDALVATFSALARLRAGRGDADDVSTLADGMAELRRAMRGLEAVAGDLLE